MKKEKIHSLRARDLVFPLIRPLTSIFTCLREMEDAGFEGPSEALSNEMSGLFNYIAKAMEKLIGDAVIEDDDIGKILHELPEMGDLLGNKPEMIKRLNAINETLASFCSRNKTELRTAYNSNKDYYRDLFRQMVNPRSICMIHGRHDREAVESITETLRSGCFYDVDLVSINGYNPLPYDVVSVYTMDSSELGNIANARINPPVSLALINLGPDMGSIDPTMLRLAQKLHQQDVKIIYRPFATLRLLEGYERVYYRNLIADQVEEPVSVIEDQEIAIEDEMKTQRQVFEKKLDMKSKKVENSK